VWLTASPAWVGKMAARKGLNRGRERWCRGFGEDSTTARRLQGELDDGTRFGEVDNGAGSKEIFDGKFWQPDGVTECLQGLGFA
jgi:hypothetical protein